MAISAAVLVLLVLSSANAVSADSQTNTNNSTRTTTRPGITSNVLGPTVAPKVVQTLDFDYSVVTHLIQTSTGCAGNQGCYTWVTPEGNLTFSQELPYEMTYSYFGGSVPVSFSAFAVRQSGLLTSASSVVTINQRTYIVNSTEVNAFGVKMGYLTVLYNFTSTPFEATVQYHSLIGVRFNILWVVSGGNYVTNDATNSTEEVNSAATNMTIGSATSVYMTQTPSGYQSSTVIDVSQAGGANFVYGLVQFDNSTYDAVVAVFPQDKSMIDPTIYQKPETTCSSPCNSSVATVTFGSSVTYGDMLVVTVVSDDLTTLSVSDTLSTSFAIQVDEQYSSCDSNSGKCQALIYSGTALKSGSDTITVNEGTSTVALRVEAWELDGVFAVGNTDSCSGGSSCSSKSYGTNSILIATGRDTTSHGSGFTYYTYASSSVAASEYEITSSSGSTSFPFSSSVSDVEAAAIFIIGSWVAMPCPSGSYICLQIEPSPSNPSTATVTSSCTNSITFQTVCPSSPLCPITGGNTNPCFSVQLNFFTATGFWEQAVIGVFPHNSTFPDGAVKLYSDWFNLNVSGSYGESSLSSGAKVFNSNHWYQQAYTIAVYQNGTMFFGIRDQVSGNATTISHAPWSTSTYGVPDDKAYEGGPIGNSEGEYATFSASWSADLLFTASSFPSPNSCAGGVQWYGQTFYTVPATAENSNFC
jgi:hypothetical protein